MSTSSFSGPYAYGPSYSGTGHLLVTPTQRDRAAEILKDLYAEERIDRLELDRRLDIVLQAKTRHELNAAFDGIVARPTAPAAFSRPQDRSYDPLPVPTDARVTGGLTHWLGYPTLFVGPLIVGFVAGKNNPDLRRHAMEAANFQLTFFAVSAVIGFLAHHFVGPIGILMPFIGIAWFVLTAIAGLATMAGRPFRYPFTLRIFR